MGQLYNSGDFFILSAEINVEPYSEYCATEEGAFSPHCIDPNGRFIYPHNVKRFSSRDEAAQFRDDFAKDSACGFKNFSIRLASARWVAPNPNATRHQRNR